MTGSRGSDRVRNLGHRGVPARGRRCRFASHYGVATPGFFVPSILSLAAEGKEFHYGATRKPTETWLPWSRTTEAPVALGLASVLHVPEPLSEVGPRSYK